VRFVGFKMPYYDDLCDECGSKADFVTALCCLCFDCFDCFDR